MSNIKAYEKSLELKKSGDPDYIINARYVEENMNRCCSVESLNNPINYERQRANELTEVLKKLDYQLDIHSTMNPS
ncbi:MAG: succinylglutamate desuccinylase/aspartoacylase family protein [bacterium]